MTGSLPAQRPLTATLVLFESIGAGPGERSQCPLSIGVKPICWPGLARSRVFPVVACAHPTYPRANQETHGGLRRYCVQCGSELKQGARFCANCGRPAAANSPQPAVAGEHGVGPRNLQAPPPSPGWDASAVPPDGALFPPPGSGHPPHNAPFPPEGSRLPSEGSRLPPDGQGYWREGQGFRRRALPSRPKVTASRPKALRSRGMTPPRAFLSRATTLPSRETPPRTGLRSPGTTSPPPRPGRRSRQKDWRCRRPTPQPRPRFRPRPRSRGRPPR